MTQSVFVIDCHLCRKKVAAQQHGILERSGMIEEIDEPFSHRIVVGKCPECGCSLVGESKQTAFEGYDSEHDEWSDVVRVYPKPPKRFISFNIPRVARNSLSEAEKAIQADANTAACVMLGRALESVCRDQLTTDESETPPRRNLMLGEGLQQLKERGIIDQRLFDWSEDLKAFRNIAAHPDETVISRQDAEDLQSFVYAIIEYIYDLTERYEEFKERIERRNRRTSRSRQLRQTPDSNTTTP